MKSHTLRGPDHFLSYSCPNCKPFAERVSIAVKSQTGSDNRRVEINFVEIGPPATRKAVRIEDRKHCHIDGGEEAGCDAMAKFISVFDLRPWLF